MTDPRMTPTNDAPVTVEQCDRDLAVRVIPCSTIAECLWLKEVKAGDHDGDYRVQAFARHRLAALASAPAGKLNRDFTARRIKELMDGSDGFWRACSGCQEGEDGYVSECDYPFDPLFRCQPGGGCSECGGIGVLWDDGAGYDDITGDEEPASAPAGDGDVGLLEAARDLLDAHKRLGGAAEYRADLWACLEANVERLARPRAAVGEPLPADVAELVNRIGRAEWGATDALDADEHGKHVADSVRITAANFDQTEPQRMQGLYVEGTETVICHVGTSPNSPAVARALAGAWNHLCDLAALQSPPAKVEG